MIPALLGHVKKNWAALGLERKPENPACRLIFSKRKRQAELGQAVAIIYDGAAEPVLVAKVRRKASFLEEFRALKRMREEISPRLAEHVSRPLGMARIGEFSVCYEAPLAGKTVPEINAGFRPEEPGYDGFNSGVFRRIGLSLKLLYSAPKGFEAVSAKMFKKRVEPAISEVASILSLDRKAAGALKAGFEEMFSEHEGLELPNSYSHPDLSPNNILLPEGCGLVNLVDWEAPARTPLPASGLGTFAMRHFVDSFSRRLVRGGFAEEFEKAFVRFSGPFGEAFAEGMRLSGYPREFAKPLLALSFAREVCVQRENSQFLGIHSIEAKMLEEYLTGSVGINAELARPRFYDFFQMSNAGVLWEMCSFARACRNALFPHPV